MNFKCYYLSLYKILTLDRFVHSLILFLLNFAVISQIFECSKTIYIINLDSTLYMRNNLGNIMSIMRYGGKYRARSYIYWAVVTCDKNDRFIEYNLEIIELCNSQNSDLFFILIIEKSCLKVLRN